MEVTLEKSLADNTWSSLLQDTTPTASLPLSDGLDKDYVSSEELTDIEEKLKEMRRKRVSDRERERERERGREGGTRLIVCYCTLYMY